ncbi:adenosine deaminase 2-A-like isoform X1 [Neoarius graeffei]|uniref:adenosine deaminase 2-A-like isoform X1 n=1 Tax=Neoarius graeffei TaxID=443677 RepID=UPI00298BCE2D|nr:adenosine deaminase 2-A-like isoform X1 [Neoarius graeffei]
MRVLPWRIQLALTWLLLLCFTPWCSSRPDPRQRETLMKMEVKRAIGGGVVLNKKEKLLDEKLYQMKWQEMEAADFPPAMHFFKAKSLIDASPVFNFLQKMPKGAALHVHDFSMVDVEWLVKNVTYRENCYVCFTDGGFVRFVFSSVKPKAAPYCSTWALLKTIREKCNTTELDNSFIRNMTLVTEDPDSDYPNQDVIWTRFEEAFKVAYGLVTYAPVFKEYLYEGFRQLYVDNIMYVEIRALLPLTYELDGRKNSRDWSMRACREVLQHFTAQYPDFLGARIIFTVHRSLNSTQASEVVEEAMTLQRNFPDIMAGFDFVGREESGNPLWYFKEALGLPEERGVRLPYFFHAGETDSEGTAVDQNMMDALLFNTSRIGHGFAIVRHPVVKERAREMDVAVEVCPISNQVLKLVSDLRNHPAAVLMAEGYPMVISSDDPALFGVTGLSYDFYQAFMGFGGMKSNLATLKELVLNSLRYSSLSPTLKEKAIAALQVKWDKFVSETLL